MINISKIVASVKTFKVTKLVIATIIGITLISEVTSVSAATSKPLNNKKAVVQEVKKNNIVTTNKTTKNKKEVKNTQVVNPKNQKTIKQLPKKKESIKVSKLQTKAKPQPKPIQKKVQPKPVPKKAQSKPVQKKVQPKHKKPSGVDIQLTNKVYSKIKFNDTNTRTPLVTDLTPKLEAMFNKGCSESSIKSFMSKYSYKYYNIIGVLDMIYVSKSKVVGENPTPDQIIKSIPGLGQRGYIFIKIIYNANTNTNTVWYASASPSI